LRPLRGSDAIVTGSAVALYLGGGLLGRKRSEAAPASLVTAAAPQNEINGFDRKIRKLAVGHRSLEKRLLLDHLSSSTLMVSLFQPVGMLIATDVPHKWSRDVPVVAEATAVTLSVNAFVKHLTHRSRPVAHFCESEHAVVPCPPDTRLSFFSGHTSSAFAAAVAAGTIADFHHLENRKWIWASGLTFATATGVLRVMSDQHYATDVLTGMAAGGLAGWLIPKLHQPDRESSPSAGTPPAAPAVVAAVPVVLLGGRSAALVTVGAIGGGPYFGVHWRW
jgi:membrane-associated phospholipid phosphatase